MLGCGEVQGYLTGRPGPAEDIAFAEAFAFDDAALVDA
jgi:EAL domain-containing protein (putative c-di-GMP-specific phosphodiesterase class I)